MDLKTLKQQLAMLPSEQENWKVIVRADIDGKAVEVQVNKVSSQAGSNCVVISQGDESAAALPGSIPVEGGDKLSSDQDGPFKKFGEPAVKVEATGSGLTKKAYEEDVQAEQEYKTQDERNAEAAEQAINPPDSTGAPRVQQDAKSKKPEEFDQANERTEQNKREEDLINKQRESGLRTEPGQNALVEQNKKAQPVKSPPPVGDKNNDQGVEVDQNKGQQDAKSKPLVD